MMSGNPPSKQESAESEAFYTPQEGELTDGMGTPPLPDGQGTPLPLSHMLTSDGQGKARSPDNQGTPPPPVLLSVHPNYTQVREKLRPDASFLQCRQDQKESQKVRKGLLKGNSTSSLSTPTGKERKVRFDLLTRREWHEVGSYVPSRSSGPTPPIVLRLRRSQAYREVETLGISTNTRTGRR